MMMYQSTKMLTTTTRFSRTIATAAAAANRRTVSVPVNMRMSVGPQHFSVNTPTCHHHHHHQRCHCRHMSSNHSSMEPDWVRTAIQKMILDQAEHQGPNEATTTSPSSSSSSSLSSLSTDRTTSTSTTTTAANGAMLDSPDLEKTLLSLQNQLQEAELCIQDCYECVQDNENSMLQKEIDAADHSIDMAVAHFVDLLDAKQQQQQQQQTSTNKNNNNSNSSHVSSPPSTNYQDDKIPTEDLVKRIKQLRAEISKLKLVQQQSIVTTTTTTTTVDGKLC